MAFLWQCARWEEVLHVQMLLWEEVLHVQMLLGTALDYWLGRGKAR